MPNYYTNMFDMFRITGFVRSCLQGDCPVKGESNIVLVIILNIREYCQVPIIILNIREYCQVRLSRERKLNKSKPKE